MTREVIIGGALVLNFVLLLLFVTAIWLLRWKRPDHELLVEQAQAEAPTEPESLFAYDSWGSSNFSDDPEPYQSQLLG